MDAKKNNFDLVRLGLALIVLLSHSASVSRSEELRFLSQVLSGEFAVRGFFAISGFLIAASYLKSRSFTDYALKRCRRIFPAYIATIIACLILGALVTTLPVTEYLLHRQTGQYALANFSFMNFLQPSLPGVFLDNPNQPMDGSLWTIKSELTLYFLLPCLIPLFKKSPLPVYLLIYLISCGWFYYFTCLYTGPKGHLLAKQFVGLSGYFFFGTLLAMEPRIMGRLKDITVIALVLYLLTRESALRHFIEPVAFSSVVLLFCTGMFNQFPVGRYGDFSYGIYLFHWPVIQLLIHFGVYRLNPFLGVGLTLVVTLILAIISWNFLEKRWLKRGRMQPVIGTTVRQH